MLDNQKKQEINNESMSNTGTSLMSTYKWHAHLPSSGELRFLGAINWTHSSGERFPGIEIEQQGTSNVFNLSLSSSSSSSNPLPTPTAFPICIMSKSDSQDTTPTIPPENINSRGEVAFTATNTAFILCPPPPTVVTSLQTFKIDVTLNAESNISNGSVVTIKLVGTDISFADNPSSNGSVSFYENTVGGTNTTRGTIVVTQPIPTP